MTSRLLVDKIEGKSTSSTVDFPSGTMVQQVNSLDSAETADRTYQSTSSTSFTHMTNFDIKITPKFASSKILYVGAFNFYAHSNAQYGYISLFQHISGGSATQVSTSSATGSGAIGPSMYQQVPVIHMMTPNTTNEITYKIYTKANSSSGSVYLGWNQSAGSLDSGTNFCAIEIRA